MYRFELAVVWGVIHFIPTLLQDDVTFTGAISGDIYVWKGPILAHVVERAHSGPIFAMSCCLGKSRILSAGKERGSVG